MDTVEVPYKSSNYYKENNFFHSLRFYCLSISLFHSLTCFLSLCLMHSISSYNCCTCRILFFFCFFLISMSMFLFGFVCVWVSIYLSVCVNEWLTEIWLFFACFFCVFIWRALNKNYLIFACSLYYPFALLLAFYFFFWHYRCILLLLYLFLYLGYRFFIFRFFLLPFRYKNLQFYGLIFFFRFVFNAFFPRRFGLSFKSFFFFFAFYFVLFLFSCLLIKAIIFSYPQSHKEFFLCVFRFRR